ncbi:DUF2911 domain-containing protein [Paraflavitalea sp. CAU 1676]|uniref:DUF2911 domain-containing protein n=1 Tax=Paraflavitalea sp. CAU 1676 TaxID=3032598 RepID=UPI0023DA5DE2|nr:DUF2911 domain-containing protein [Paraflavitalea sp. CAU 1676]MDF2188671.1 DUF2911 domain-containing protein [Paraflavitalea sp. CAU 1676]
MFQSISVSRLWLVIILLSGTLELQAQKEAVCYNPNLMKDTSKRSIKSAAVGVISLDSVKINYHSPGVRGRIIWGGLVPYDEVWVTGAHDATTLEVAHPFIVGGKEIPAGKYALFTIPGKKEWTVIINSKWQQHLATEYDQKEDLIRIKVKPIKHALTERLQYFIVPGKGNTGRIAVAWEKLRIEFPITVKG